MFILQIIIAPIFEEIVLRGIILEGFLNKYKPITSIIVSSVIFGLWHGNIPQFITATILGILVGIIYYKTRSTVLCIVSHILNNGLTFLYINFNIRTFFIGAVIFIISGILLEKYIRELKYDGTNISSAG
ncbi:CPBP family intramembrane glutamic endopeptidase [Clostridium botulinum]|uniref:CPBP family intramembrane glutamic endopeptidase n=1 Tax=Clostridium botulinum TaxID=1491 RepID=UPI0028FCF833|nr:CPBP family intramembrane glutamic endopeptidase [Clostridium botulinum]